MIDGTLFTFRGRDWLLMRRWIVNASSAHASTMAFFPVEKAIRPTI